MWLRIYKASTQLSDWRLSDSLTGTRPADHFPILVKVTHFEHGGENIHLSSHILVKQEQQWFSSLWN